MAMDAISSETAGCQSYAEILDITCKVKNTAALRTRIFEKWFFLPYALAKVELSGAEKSRLSVTIQVM